VFFRLSVHFQHRVESTHNTHTDIDPWINITAPISDASHSRRHHDCFYCQHTWTSVFILVIAPSIAPIAIITTTEDPSNADDHIIVIVVSVQIQCRLVSACSHFNRGWIGFEKKFVGIRTEWGDRKPWPCMHINNQNITSHHFQLPFLPFGMLVCCPKLDPIVH
jgi:hypothetical protein